MKPPQICLSTNDTQQAGHFLAMCSTRAAGSLDFNHSFTSVPQAMTCVRDFNTYQLFYFHYHATYNNALEMIGEAFYQHTWTVFSAQIRPVLEHVTWDVEIRIIYVYIYICIYMCIYIYIYVYIYMYIYINGYSEILWTQYNHRAPFDLIRFTKHGPQGLDTMQISSRSPVWTLEAFDKNIRRFFRPLVMIKPSKS